MHETKDKRSKSKYYRNTCDYIFLSKTDLDIYISAA